MIQEPKKMTDNIQSFIQADGAVAKNALVHDGLMTIGKYFAECVGPKEHLRSEYIKLRDRALDISGVIKRRRKNYLDASFTELQILKERMEEMLEPKWSDVAPNVVTTDGKNYILDKTLTGSAYTAAWYLGLIDADSYMSTPVVGNTAASHATWVESSEYAAATRPAASFLAASGGVSTLSSAAAFAMNADTTIKGCGMWSNSTKGGITGSLLSAGLFTGGDEVLQNGDTLNVSYQLTLP